MRPTQRNPEHLRRDRREKIHRQRLAAPVLRRAYPGLAVLELRFVFSDGSPMAPADQTHFLHPPAAAFFRFPCTFADCDGEFDLTAAIEGMAASSARQQVMHLDCQGVRARDRATDRRCGLHLACTIRMSYLGDLAA
ncbi:MAG: hypothetical protein WCE48_08355 [Steroidobacteraceae bacterium]